VIGTGVAIAVREVGHSAPKNTLQLVGLRLVLAGTATTHKIHLQGIHYSTCVVRFRVWNTSSHVILTADYINTAVGRVQIRAK
jgi:hypothetical protein